MKIIQRLEHPERNNIPCSGDDLLIISATSSEWDIIARFTGQKVAMEAPDELNIMKFNRAMLKLVESEHHLKVVIKELEKIKNGESTEHKENS